MRIDISLLPALAATFMLVFARIGAMVMLLPGLGETNIPVRIKLAIALLLTLVILPLHRAAYQIDMQSITALLVLDDARNRHRHRARRHRAGDAVGAAGRGIGDRPAARPRIRHHGRSDPGAAGPADRQLPHHPRPDAAVRHRQPSSGDRSAQRQLLDLLAGRGDAERRCRLARDPRLHRRLQDRDAAVGAVPGVRHRLQYRARRAGAADAGRCRSISSACRCRSWSAS